MSERDRRALVERRDAPACRRDRVRMQVWAGRRAGSRCALASARSADDFTLGDTSTGRTYELGQVHVLRLRAVVVSQRRGVTAGSVVREVPDGAGVAAGDVGADAHGPVDAARAPTIEVTTPVAGHDEIGEVVMHANPVARRGEQCSE